MSKQTYDKLNKTTTEAVERATGKGWDYWIALIDKEGGDKLTHKEIARMLSDKKYIESGWWCQQVTVGYEYAKGRRVLGETADAGFEIGVSKTFEASQKKIWELLTSPEGLKIWLGNTESLALEKGASYETTDGTTGEIRSIAEGTKIRLTVKPQGQEKHSTLQIYVMPNGQYGKTDPKSTKTSVRFHHEKLQSEKERETMKQHWQEVLEQLDKILSQ